MRGDVGADFALESFMAGGVVRADISASGEPGRVGKGRYRNWGSFGHDGSLLLWWCAKGELIEEHKNRRVVKETYMVK